MPLWAYGAIPLTEWLLWIIYWTVRARGVKAIAKRESVMSRLSHIVPLVIGAILLIRHRDGTGLNASFLPPGMHLPAYWVGIVLIAVGLLFTVWPREYLGGNWSGTVTLKADHELIRSGPYAWVRHPIYTGILIAMLGVLLAQGQWRGLIGFVLVAAALVHKMKIEERFLSEQFGEQYARYRKEVKALLPGLF